MILAGAPTEPARARELADALDAEFTDFAERGPTDEEVETARKQILNTLDEQIKEPSFWRGTLAEMDLRGTTLDEILGAEEMYGSFSAADVREAFARYYTPSGKFTVIVRATEAPADEGG